MPVTSVTESQVVDPAGNLSDVYEISFTLEGRPGTFTVTVAKGDQVVERANAAIQRVAQEVGAIFQL